MSTENFVKSDTEVDPQDFAKSLPLPPTWAATIGLGDYWENQENGHRLEACEHADDDIEADQEWTLPGYDPDDFREG